MRKPRRRTSIYERHEAKVDHNGPIPAHRPELGQCWPWTASFYRNGYGQIGIGGRGAGVTGAHRVAWERAYGPIPEGKWVLHKCDNRRCQRPDHLFLGDNPSNVDDMLSKGRAAWQVDPAMPYLQRGDGHWARRTPERIQRGSSKGSAKLTETQVLQILQRYAGGERNKAALGRAFGVSEVLIGKIVRREIWTHVQFP